jgi:hypothetical protein
MWCVQKERDAKLLRTLLQETGFTSIVVQHEAPEL